VRSSRNAPVFYTKKRKYKRFILGRSSRNEPDW